MLFKVSYVLIFTQSFMLSSSVQL